MKTALYKILFAPLLGCVLASLTSCEHKDLCYNHDEHARKYSALIVADYERRWQYTYNGYTDWASAWPSFFDFTYESLRPATPDGLRVMLYAPDGTNSTTNLPPHGGTISLARGEHSMLLYNNGTEYIVFDDLNTLASAKATTRTRSRASYLGNQFGGTGAAPENTVNPPDMLYGAFVESYTPVKKAVPDTINVTMRPLVYSYVVRYEFKSGVKYIALARGALAGMAESVYLNSGRTSEEEATVLFDCDVRSFGAQAVVNSFGIPDFPNEHYTRAVRKYALNLEVRLRNGNVKSFDFDVTRQVSEQPHGGVIVVSDLEITDEEGTEGSSGFDVTINDWGEYEDIVLPL